LPLALFEYAYFDFILFFTKSIDFKAFFYLLLKKNIIIMKKGFNHEIKKT